MASPFPTTTTAAAASSPPVPENTDNTPDVPTDAPYHISNENQLSYCNNALEYFRNKRTNDMHAIHLEFEMLKAVVDEVNYTVGMDQMDYSENRYTDILPFDSTEVLKKRKVSTPSQTGYINASLNMSTEGVSRFIATQGPMPQNSEEFWAMIIQNRCPAIVTLSDANFYLKVSNRNDHAWRQDFTKEVGDICIHTKLMEINNMLALRWLEVKNKKSEEPPAHVFHMEYMNWPEQGVPRHTLPVREIFNRVKYFPPSGGPIAVQCRAGIGRTGTYCAIHNTIQRILVGDTTALDLVNTITSFSYQRNGMVQTPDQYLFCYDAIIDELENIISFNTPDQ